VIPEAPAAPVPGELPPPVLPIPAVSLGAVIGLLEVLENEGDLELFELTQRVDVPLTQLLLVVKAAELLGWVTTPGQRVEMTAEGRRLIAAGIATRKKLLNARLRDIFVFDLVMKSLERSGNEVAEEVVLRELAQHFPHENPGRLLRTIVGWGRYGELFKYSSTRRVFFGLRESGPPP
jgi:NitT/TauT family transport system ATP-binding protein